MNIEEVREICLNIKGCEESMPFFNHPILVFKVAGKMFLLCNIEPKEAGFSIDIKCDPETNLMLQDKYVGALPSKFTRSNTWMAICIESDVPDEVIKEQISNSVKLVISKLSKKKQSEYYNQE